MKRRLVNLSKLHRKIYGEKLVELANMAIAALVVGQALSEKGLVLRSTVVGLAVGFVCYSMSYFLLKEVKT